MTLGDKLVEAYAAWVKSVSSCCGSAKDHDDEPSPRSLEKESGVYYSQPGFVTPPAYVPESRQELRPTSRKERAPRRGLWEKGSFSVRGRFRSHSTPWHRPQISHPTNFRHLHSESFRFPEHNSPVRSRNSFRPIQLDMGADDLSFVMPNMDDDDLPDIRPPPRAYTAGSFDSDSATLAHQRSNSSMSFHLPRRPLPDSARASPFPYNHSTISEDSPPRIPVRSRLRAYTSPNIERSVERIASAMIELDRIQADIESVIERQSIYANSRPSTAYGGVDPPHHDFAAALAHRLSTAVDLEPMPDIPALPAVAPSFAERLSTERPRTAPAPAQAQRQRPIEIPRRGKPFAEASAAFTLPAPPPPAARRVNGRQVDIPLAPPLPLVLRPPLRKKKSFSRVSNWLFPGNEAPGATVHAREISLDSVTNAPRPVTDKEGFYQCVGARESFDSVSTVSSWTTTEDRGTAATGWGSEERTPVEKSPVKQNPLRQSPFKQMPLKVEVPAALRVPAKEHRPTSVGVAF